MDIIESNEMKVHGNEFLIRVAHEELCVVICARLTNELPDARRKKLFTFDACEISSVTSKFSQLKLHSF